MPCGASGLSVGIEERPKVRNLRGKAQVPRKGLTVTSLPSADAADSQTERRDNRAALPAVGRPPAVACPCAVSSIAPSLAQSGGSEALSDRSGPGSLDTLAQLVNRPTERHKEETRAKLERRARARYQSLAVSTALAEYARQRAGTPEGELEQSYRNTVYCAGVIKQESGVLTARYCGNRWCLSCNRIRMGKAINVYQPEIAGWEGPQMVTTTVRNVAGGELRETIKTMRKCSAQIVRKLRRQGHQIRMLRKTECTYNAQRDDYHPHHHTVIELGSTAEAYRAAWLDFAPRYGLVVDPKGQDVRPLDTETGLTELFKYFSKLTAKTESGGREYIGVAQLDVMFRAMRGQRVYQAYGFKTTADANEVDELDGATVAISREEEDALWLWDDEMTDWVDTETGECLTGHVPDAKTSRFASYYASHNGITTERAPP